jgi:general stress protein 26
MNTDASAPDTRQLALAVMQADPFPQLATCDGRQARLRPVSPVRTEQFTVYVASLRSSNKTGEIDANPNVELCYLTSNHDQVRITGIAETITDAALRQDIWDSSPLLRSFLKSIDNPEFMLYRIVPLRVRFMKEWDLHYQEVNL